MSFVFDSQKNLISSLQLCGSLDRDIGCVVYSKFNLILLSFLCQRGFVKSFNFFKKGSNGYILFSLRRVNGLLLFNKVWSPHLKISNSGLRVSKYKTFRALLKTFTSEFVVISTNRGLMTVDEAVSRKTGGLVLCVLS